MKDDGFIDTMVAIVGNDLRPSATLCTKKLTEIIAAASFLRHPLGLATTITPSSGSRQGDLHVEEFLGQVPLRGLIFFILHTIRKTTPKHRIRVYDMAGSERETWKMKANSDGRVAIDIKAAA